MNARGPQPNQVYVDPVLTNLSVDYRNSSYLSEIIFPVFKVDKPTGLFYIYDKSKFRVEDDLRAPGQRANKVDYAFTSTTYGPLVEHALEEDILDETREQQNAPLNNEEDATIDLTERIALRKEIDCFNILASSANFGSTTTLSTATQKWSDYANSDPIGDMKAGVDVVKKAIFKPANQLTVVIGYDALRKLEEHPQFIEKIKYSERGVISVDIIQSILGVKQVLVSDAEKNTANEGQTDSMGYVAPNDCYILYINPSVALKSVTYGLTLRMTRGTNGQGLASDQGGLTRLVKSQRFELEGKDTIQVSDKYQHYIVAKEAGYALYSVI